MISANQRLHGVMQQLSAMAAWQACLRLSQSPLYAAWSTVLVIIYEHSVSGLALDMWCGCSWLHMLMYMSMMHLVALIEPMHRRKE